MNPRYYLFFLFIINFLIADFGAYAGYDISQNMEVENIGNINMSRSLTFGFLKEYSPGKGRIGYGIEYMAKAEDKNTEGDIKISIYDMFFKWTPIVGKIDAFIRLGVSNSIDCDILGIEIDTRRNASYGLGIIYNNIHFIFNGIHPFWLYFNKNFLK